MKKTLTTLLALLACAVPQTYGSGTTEEGANWTASSNNLSRTTGTDGDSTTLTYKASGNPVYITPSTLDATAYDEFHVTDGTGNYSITFYGTVIKGNDVYLEGTTRFMNHSNYTTGAAIEAKNITITDNAWLRDYGTGTNVVLNAENTVTVSGSARLSSTDVTAKKHCVGKYKRTVVQ